MFKLKEYSKSDYWSFALTVSNPHEYYENGQYRTNFCDLHFALFGHSWWFKIPEIFKPRKKWVDTSKYEWSKSDGYWDHTMRQYGVSVTDDAVHLYYGIQPGSWSSRDKENSDHSTVLWIPWKKMTYKYEELYTPDWKTHAVIYEKNRGVPYDFENERKVKESVPRIKFKFNDFDGEEIIATCYISKRVWRHGISWCKWLGYIRKPLVKYSLDLEFSKETGYEKGSWKGGTIGHSVEMKYGESPLDAFMRYGSTVDRYKNHGRQNRGFKNISVIA